MKFEDFAVSDFSQVRGSVLAPAGGFVYVLSWVREGVEIPFYVGQTDRFPGRMNDYRLANFKACTDFCVGEAVKYLQSKNYPVVVRHKASPDPPKDEKGIIRNLLVSGVRLLNCLPRYDYRTDSEDEERKAVHQFCEMLVNTRE